MGISLYGLTPATTYDALIKTGDNAPIDATLKPLSDGVGTNLPMEASTTAINFTGALQQSGVAVPTAAQVAAKQDTLVSGTNIKTINGASVLGSGNIVTPSTNPSGVSGAIQFSNGSAFASDAANLFWDDTNNRLGVGTNAPTSPVTIQNTSAQILAWSRVAGVSGSLDITNVRTTGGQGTVLNVDSFSFRNSSLENYLVSEANRLGIGTNNDALTSRATIKGSGSTSATTSLLVQNSSALEALKITDDGTSVFKSSTGTLLQLNANGDLYAGVNNNAQMQVLGSASTIIARSPQFWFRNDGGPTGQYYANFIGGQFAIGKSTTQAVASALIEMSSTTMGFLPPRMTTTQKNAITIPATGLVLYDSTTNKLCCYNGSTWNDLF
jgi:hypothetical protein